MKPKIYPETIRITLVFMVICMSLFLSSCLMNKIGGSSSREPEELSASISPGAKKLIEAAFRDTDPARLTDHHVHIAGLGAGGTGAFVSPAMRSWLHPMQKLKFATYLSAARISHTDKADQEYANRLVSLTRAIAHHGKYRILALDKAYDPDGTVNLGKTHFHVPNDYVVSLVRQYPDIFVPAISVHPYRPDAAEELEKWAKQGIRYVKWLPNSMGMDPSDPKTDFFYEKMKAYGMILLSHTGEEQAVEAGEDQELGNPLRLRRPLDHGVPVIMAHCASLGTCVDSDSPKKEKVPCFDLFIRLMDEKKYEGLLFGDISGLLHFNRPVRMISTILKRGELHSRLLNGTDYPLPAINIVIRTGDWAKRGFITEEERKYINEIFDYNPLLSDFVLKRTIKLPGTDQKLSACIFMNEPLSYR